MKIYCILERERLCDISKKFNISIEELAEYNGITNVDSIDTGDLIFIPLKGEVDV